jgi:glycosyltransferase involved in cell wall biosynthesis
MPSPLVSVYIPTKNRRSLVAAAINSVRGQSYKNLEIIVVNDGSTDDTADYLARLQEEEPRLVVINHEKSGGGPRARNSAILAAKGKFVTGLDDDDEFMNEHIAGLVGYWQVLEKVGDIPAGIYVQYMYRYGAKRWPSNKPGSYTADTILHEGNRVGNQVFAPRQHFIDAGLFDEEMPAQQDLEFWHRMMKKFGTMRLLDLPTYVFDISPRDDRISTKQKQTIIRAFEMIYRKHGEGRPHVRQRLLLQAHSDYYGFPVTVRDVVHFASYGLWPSGNFQMLRKLIRGNKRRGASVAATSVEQVKPRTAESALKA